MEEEVIWVGQEAGLQKKKKEEGTLSSSLDTFISICILTKIENADDLQWKTTSKILKVEYLSNPLLDHTQILNLS